VLSEITMDSPKSKVVLQADYRVHSWNFTARETRWGTTAEVMADQSLGPPYYYTNVITPTYTTDLRIAYALGRGFEISAGAINAFNVYPNKTIYQTRDVSNSAVYPPNSPFGFDGGSYYGRLEYRW
jgi:iron complex outermembrane receptor protein